MPDKFQETGHRQTTYQRPNQSWVCGHVGEGGAGCHLGPNPKGRCPGGVPCDGRLPGECLPRRQGDRWLCTRAETRGGNPCAEGPLPDGSCCRPVLPCQPRPSLRRQRGRVTLMVMLAAIGFAVLLLSRGTGPTGKGGDASLSPGALSAPHTQIAAECARCHSQMALTPDRITGLHQSAFQHRAVEDGRLCLACHQGIGGAQGQSAFLAHTLPEAALPPSKGSGGPGPDRILEAAARFVPPPMKSGEIACDLCHREHHGQEGSLTDLTNRQCQVCHQARFASFADGHPDFETLRYPYARRPRIVFDHFSHFETHFPDTADDDPAKLPAGYQTGEAHGKSKTCLACHVPDDETGLMTVLSYEVACGKCHDPDTRGGRRLPFLALPTLDAGSLDRWLATDAPGGARSSGTWVNPATTTDLPGPMLHLLSTVERQAWLSLRQEGLTLADLTKAKPARLANAETLVNGVKFLLHDLSRSGVTGKTGHLEMERRLVEAGLPGGASLVGGLPPDLFDRFRKRGEEAPWPALRAMLDEAAAARDGRFPPARPGAAATPAPPAVEPDPDDLALKDEVWARSGGWQEEGGTLYYRSTGHADPLLRAWLDATAANASEPVALLTLTDSLGFASGVNTSASGKCLMCHSIDEELDVAGDPVSLVVNWKAYGARSVPGLPDRRLTAFRHAPHVVFMDCRACHSIDPASEDTFAASYPGKKDKVYEEGWVKKADPSRFTANFSPLRKRDCAVCHTPQGAGDRCLECHRYHPAARDNASLETRHAIPSR